jgi:bacillithiol system protein YtxJ
LVGVNKIQTVSEWQEVFEGSKTTPQFVMKHSATCPISASAYNAFNEVETDVPKNYLIVQDSRTLSNEIESDLRVQHASPQLFLLKDGQVMWQATHYSISKSKIEMAVEGIQ